jgi:hypothetical protein
MNFFGQMTIYQKKFLVKQKKGCLTDFFFDKWSFDQKVHLAERSSQMTRF